jgi:hypothetical protein
MNGKSLLNPLDVVRLALDDYEPTLVAVREHFDRPASRMSYNWLYRNARFAIAAESGLRREAVLAGLSALSTKRAQDQNLQCWLLIEELYNDKSSRCWDLDPVNLGFGRDRFIPVRPSAVRLDRETKRVAVVVVQPRKTFAPNHERMGMLGFILAEACIAPARETLFAATPSIEMTVEFANLGTAPGSKTRWPRLQRLDDFPAPDVPLIKHRIGNLARALDVVRAEILERRRRDRGRNQEPPGPLFE